MELVDKRLTKEAEKAEQIGEYYDALECYSKLHDKLNAARIFNKMKHESLVDYCNIDLAQMLYDAGSHDEAKEVIGLWLDSEFSESLDLDVDSKCGLVKLYQKLNWDGAYAERLEGDVYNLKQAIARSVTCPEVQRLREIGFSDEELEDIVRSAESQVSSLWKLGDVGKAYLELGMRAKAREIADTLLKAYDGDAASEIYIKLGDKEKVKECEKYCHDYFWQRTSKNLFHTSLTLEGIGFGLLSLGAILQSCLLEAIGGLSVTMGVLPFIYDEKNRSNYKNIVFNDELDDKREEAEKALFATSA